MCNLLSAHELAATAEVRRMPFFRSMREDAGPPDVFATYPQLYGLWSEMRTRPVGIITLKKRTLSPVARLFIEQAREVAKPLSRLK
jgi:hypothetical protein